MPRTTDALVIIEKRFGPIDEALEAQFRQQMDLAQQLYDLRAERGLTQADVAKLVGTTPAVVESIEESDYDAACTRQILEKLSKALDSDPARAFASGTAVGTA
jgi:DNA-binding XRE family transcriptional regulator